MIKKLLNGLLLILISFIFLSDEVNAQEEYTFSYTGDYQEFVAPTNGFYKIELWGAKGNTPTSDRAQGGLGAYTSGVIWLDSGEKLYVYVGEHRLDRSASFNAGSTGGGSIDSVNGGSVNGYGGGGATDIRLVAGTWNDFNSLKSRIMVAAGGGGATDYAAPVDGGYGGALVGGSGVTGYYDIGGNNTFPTGGTQISGGTGTIPRSGSYYGGAGSFGQGGNGHSGFGSGGGGGYYGGGGGGNSSHSVDSGAGGSSFISGHENCDAITEDSTSTTITHTGESTHYSGKVFSSTVMLAGNEEMPSHDGTSKMVGNDGNGYAKISLLEPLKDFEAEGTIIIKLEEQLNGYNILIPEDNYQTKLTATVTEEDLYITGLGEVTLSSGDIYYVSAIDSNGFLSVYRFYVKLQSFDIKIGFEGIDFEFDVNQYDYTLDVDYDTKKLTPIIENSDGVTYEVINADSLKQGQNKVLINFTNGDKTIKYTFNVNRNSLSQFEFTTTGDVQKLVIPKDSYYKIELWGAKGNTPTSDRAQGGLGAYTSGIIWLEEGTELFVYVGEHRRDRTASFNAGSTGGSAIDPLYGGGENGYGGGGATDIRLVGGSWDSFDSLKSRIMVAAGGGGATDYAAPVAGGYGGSFVGGSGVTGYYSQGGNNIPPTGGTQISGGSTSIPRSGSLYGTPGSFGKGGNGHASFGSGGGGGYYGGGGAGYTSYSVDSGAGGSSFISGHDGCNAITEASTSATITHTGESTHYSGYVFTDTVMYAGNENMPTYDGTDVMLGNDGSGYAKITEYIENDNIDSNTNLISLTSSHGKFDQEFSNSIREYNLALNENDTEIYLDATPENIDALVSNLGKYNIAPGTTDITISVTATDGTIKNIIIHVTRNASTNPYLLGIEINGIPYGDFKEDKFDYEIEVPYSMEILHVTGIKTNENQTISGDGVFVLENNEAEVKMLVVSEDGEQNKLYTIKFTREKTTLLKAITFEQMNKTLYLEPDKFEYDLEVYLNIHNLDLIVDPYYDGVSIAIEGNKYIGENSKTITVTSSLEGLDDSVYTFNIIVTKNMDYYNYEYSYTGDYETFIVPASGYYDIELWGAQGNMPTSNRAVGGNGAYTKGMIYLVKDQELYVYVGQNRMDRAASFNAGSIGGGSVDSVNGGSVNGYGGGGATDIRLVSGTWNDFNSLKSRIIVAGGGGGATDYAAPVAGGYAGGLIGGSGITGYYGPGGKNTNATGGTQISGGVSTIPRASGGRGTSGSFGIGGNGNGYWGSGGGGGYYGGGGGGYASHSVDSGAGGSSFISGHKGSNAILDTSINTAITHSGQQNHYSSFVFTNTVMIDGAGYSWTDTQGELTLMPNPAGGYYDLGTGNTENGYAKITSAELIPNDNYLDTLTLKTSLRDINIDFEPWTLEYNVELFQEEGIVSVDATPKDILATITGTGNIDVPPLKSTHEVVVTAQDGSIRTYKINFEREASTDPTPLDIKINKLPSHLCAVSSEYCVYTFDATKTEYKILLPINIREIEILPVLRSKYQSYEIRSVVGDEVTVLENGNVTLEYGDNTFEVEVTAEDGVTKKTYKYIITHDPKSNNNLASLEITNPVIEIENFDKYTYEYYVTIPNNVTTYEVSAIPENPDADVDIKGNTVLGAGITDCIITVTAPNGETKTYIIHAYKEQDDNVFLSSLIVTDKATGTEYNLVPEFDPLLNSYTVEVPNTVSDVKIAATAQSTSGVVTGTGDYKLKSGVNTIYVEVVNGESINEYEINIVKAKNSNPNLSNIVIDGYTLDPVFDKDTTEYFIEYDGDVAAFDITVTPEESTTIYTITGNSNNPSKIVITGIAEDKTYKVYTIYTMKNLSDNNLLSSIELSTGKLNEDFESTVKGYTVTVGSDVTTITITGIPEDPTATVKGNGTYSLVGGKNTITLEVISATYESNFYTIVVTREEDDDATLKSVTNNQNSEVSIPEDTTLGYDYLINVQYEVNTIEITGIPNSSKATVVGNGTYSLKVGNNDITLSVTAENGITENYKVRVVRDASDNDDLDFLYVKEGGLQPIFNETTIYYEVKVPNDATIPLNIEAITEDENATYEIIGNDGTLEVGVAKEIIVRVTAQKGNKKDYTLSVTRQAATEENLALESLITNRGEVQPTFSPDTLNYTLEVENEISDIEVTGTALSENVTVKGNGTYNLNVGKNAIPIFVIGTDGVQRDYQIVVTRKKSKDASLANLVVKSHTLSPIFTSETTSYSLTTSNTSLEFTTITPTEAEATYEIIGNENFTTGENTVTIRVTAPDGETTQDYVLTVTRTGSKNNNLASLSVEGYTLTPNFHKGVTFYAVEVANDLNSIIINATAEDTNATITGDGLQVITTGENYFDIVVTSETGATKTYTILVTKEASDNNYLASLYTSTGDLTPDFDKLENNYEITVPYDVDEIEIYGSTEDASATIEGLGIHNLAVGENTIKVVVTSESGIENIYEIKVTRETVNSANLLDLEVVGHDLDSEFTKDVLEYYVTVNYETTSINVNYVKEDTNATVEISGNDNLIVGMNEVKLLVTASDGVTTKEYILYVNRMLSTNNYLEYIITDKGTLSPTFNPLTLSYNISVDNDVESITIDAQVQDSASTITSGVGTHTLNKGDNKIEIKVKSMIGVTRTYTVIVNREVSTNNNLAKLQVLDDGKTLGLTPDFSKDETVYSLNVLGSTKYVNIEAIAEDINASVSGTGIKALNSGLNTYVITVTAENGSPKDYTINITREKSTNNNVLNIIPSVGTFTETFDPDIKEYTLKVSETDLFLEFDVELEDINASVAGNEKLVIPTGTSERVITVTAEDGSTNQYTITVIKENISEARLESLEIKDYELDFDPDTFTYNLKVSGAKRELLASEITAIPKDEDATVNLMGDIKLIEGIINVYTIEVIAQDGYTTQEYILNITRDSELHTLRSDIYDIIRDDEEDYVTKISVTKLENFKNNFKNENEYLKVYKDETEIIDEVNIGTGYIIKLEINGIVYDTLRIMVTGDVTGDGKVDVSDSVDLNNVILKKKVFEGYTFKAGDVTGDGKIDVSDSVKLNNYILKKIASLVTEES